jgi:hypothetical protein
VKAGVVSFVLLAALAVGGAAAARTPSRAQKAAITAALRDAQGNVPIQKITISSADPVFANISWGFANGGISAYHSSLLAKSRSGEWKMIWTRDQQQPADGACVYAPAPVVRDLFGVSCPPAAFLHGSPATVKVLRQISRGFHTSDLTPYAKTSTGLSRVCVSNADHSWAAGQAGFKSGAVVYVFFRHLKAWRPVFDSLLQQGTLPPSTVVLSLASCVGYNPADYSA